MDYPKDQVASEQQAQAEAQETEEMRNIEQEDICQCSTFPARVSPLLQRFALVTNRDLIPREAEAGCELSQDVV